MQAENLENETITLDGPDGTSFQCRILGVFPFENKEYALLLRLGANENEESEDPITVLMQLIEENDQAIFRIIESDEEFLRVVDYVKELASEFEDEEEST